MNEIIFERNMLAIASIQGSECADKIRNSNRDDTIGFEISKTGKAVPYKNVNGRKFFFHSRIDPENEARRIAEEYKKQGFYVFLGLGAGFNCSAILSTNLITRCLIIEYESKILKTIIENIDLTHILGDKRVKLLVDPGQEEIAKVMSDLYVPAITGDFVSITTRGRIDINPFPFQCAADIIFKTIESISDDYSVQSFFGKKWFNNTIKNLSRAAGPTPPIGPIKNAIITAAGPSLEDAFELIKNRSKDKYLIATDTSLRAILEQGIKPDAVISIDCQHISYYHFSLGIPEDIPLFLDLSSPPSVARLTDKLYFFSSGHPLSRYLSSRYRAFPELDTSGGNVTHAAVSLANYLGAKNIELYGADFSYPFGKTYSRGTYVYPYFDIRQSRLCPFDSLFSDFLYRNKNLERENDSDGWRYITKPLVAYKERLERFSANISSNLIRIKGKGVYTRIAQKAQKREANSIANFFSSGKLYQSSKDFLKSYEKALDSLPSFLDQGGDCIDSLPNNSKDILMTILPTAATFRQESLDNNVSRMEILEKTKNWCKKIVREQIV